MKYLYTLLFSFFFISLNAQTSNELLAQELDEFFLQELQNQPFPSIAAAIIKDGQVIWKNAYGMANIATNTPATTETLYTLASISKLFTATACAQLSEIGALDLDADINGYLPFPIINPNFPNTPITTRQLLTHTSSLHDFESDLQLWDEIGDPIYDLPTFCQEYFVPNGDLYDADNWGTTAPGNSAYWYSNAGYTLLGFIVESVAGMPFNEYTQIHILDLLNMHTAGWFYATTDMDNIAMPYGGNQNNFTPFGYYSVPEYPAAMLKANVEELSNFLIAYTQHGHFENTTIFEEVTHESIVPTSMTNGFGWWGTDTWWGDPAGNFWSHGGFMNGVRTQLNYYPTDSTGLIILTNGQGNYQAIQNQLEAYIPLFEVNNPIDAVYEQSALAIQISPNPANSFLGITNGKNAFFSMQNAQGQTISKQVLDTDNQTISITHLPVGIYFLRFQKEQQIQVNRLIIR